MWVDVRVGVRMSGCVCVCVGVYVCVCVWVCVYVCVRGRGELAWNEGEVRVSQRAAML